MVTAPPPVDVLASPWVIVRGRRGISIRQFGPNGRIVCTVPWRDADDERRARLIAAAWPLLANLKVLAAVVDRIAPRELYATELNDAVRAIALATLSPAPPPTIAPPASAAIAGD